MDARTAYNQKLQTTLAYRKNAIQIQKQAQFKCTQLRSMPCRDYRHFGSVEAAVLEYKKIWQNALELAKMVPDQTALIEYQEMLLNGVAVKHMLPPVIFTNGKITRHAREGRPNLVFKGELLLEVTDRDSNKLRIASERDCIVIDWNVELEKLHPALQSLLLFVPCQPTLLLWQI